ncbi:MAG: universal stress protein [Comamonadaceae bacterium]|jgi:nucleotide-binding universal stress UspA family protein|nr:universal stress protein [Comamonadaceae bacterium]
MKILFPADGSKYTKKALAFLVTHENLCRPEDDLVVLNVQIPMPPRVKGMVGARVINQYHQEEAQRVLDPIEKFLKRHQISHSLRYVVGVPALEIIRAVGKEGAHMVVMGTHGHGLLGRAMMGSVAQRVVTDSPVPVLLVR